MPLLRETPRPTRRTEATALGRRFSGRGQRGNATELQNLAAEFLQGSRVGAVVLDPGFRVLWVSRTFERFFGLEGEELLGRDMRQLMRSRLRHVLADSDQVAEALHGCAEESHPRRFECHIVAGDRRRERWLEHWNQPIRSGEYAGGRIDYYYDISERKRAEEAARESEDQLVQAQKMEALGRLAGGLAHDFNNLLTAITGYTDLLLRLADNDRVKTYIGEIKRAGDRAAELTSKLLTLSRRPAPSQRVVDLNQLVLNLESLLHRLIGEDVELLTRLDPALGRVRVDPGQLEQILLNLVVNARDAMPTGGRLLLESSHVEWGDDRPLDLAAGSCACLAVSDTGIGIEDEVRERIFEPFFTTKEEGKGTGLGLSTVYAGVAQNHGHIEVESAPGRGTTFRIYLPSVEGEIDAERAAGATEAPGPGHETVLLVEDDAAVRKLIRELLKQQGYTVIAAEHAAHALELVKGVDEDIEILITDVVMPGMSGPDLAERLVGRFPRMKILFISGYTDTLVLRHGVLDAEHVMLQKPFDGRLLTAKVREILDQPPAG